MSKAEGKLIFHLPGNTDHSDLLSDSWKKMDEERAGLDVIGASGIPVTVSYQGKDYETLPWLKETLAKYPSISVMNAPNSHALIPRCEEKMIRWETKNIIGNIPVTFFAEFYAPYEYFIPTKFFTFLDSMFYPYSNFTENNVDDIQISKLPDAPSIKIGDKIGIMMKEKLFGPFLNAWFRFQRDPVTIDDSSNSKLPLDNLLDKVEDIKKSGNIVVCPLDIETVYIGSILGKKAYELFFNGVKARGLEDVFAPITAYLGYFESEAKPSKHPHRILSKWNVFDVQDRYSRSLSTIHPRNERECKLLSIASGSDILSAWGRKLGEEKKKQILDGRDLNGHSVKLPITFSQDVIEVLRAAKEALVKRTSYEQFLRKLPNQSLYVQRMIAYAERHRL